MTQNIQFKIKPNGFNEIRKALLLKVIPISVFASLAGISIPYFSIGNQNNDLFLFMIPFIIITLIIGTLISSNHQKKLFESYLLKFEDDKIIREQLNTPTISINQNNIIGIIKNSNGSFTIQDGNRLNYIGIPPQIEDYELLENLLNQIKPITFQSKKTILEKYIIFIAILIPGLMIPVYLSQNKIIVGICGSILVTTLIYSLKVVRKSKNVDYRIKKNIWWIIIPFLSILANMIGKLLK